MVTHKTAPLNLAAHAGLLKTLFPEGRLVSIFPELIWTCSFVPTPLSQTYQIKVTYRLGKPPKVLVIKSKLDLGNSNKLPHVYSTNEQHLCLHYPPEKKWISSLNIAVTIVPWAAEWLYHYEIWLITGKWNGGGTVH